MRRTRFTPRPTQTARAAHASMVGTLREAPATETLAHSVHIEARSVPMAAGEEQFGQQVVTAEGLLSGK